MIVGVVVGIAALMIIAAIVSYLYVVYQKKPCCGEHRSTGPNRQRHLNRKENMENKEDEQAKRFVFPEEFADYMRLFEIPPETLEIGIELIYLLSYGTES